LESAASPVRVVETADANSPRDVEPTAHLVPLGTSANLAHRCRICPKPIGDGKTKVWSVETSIQWQIPLLMT
jgi:hypothetical protein